MENENYPVPSELYLAGAMYVASFDQTENFVRCTHGKLEMTSILNKATCALEEYWEGVKQELEGATLYEVVYGDSINEILFTGEIIRL